MGMTGGCMKLASGCSMKGVVEGLDNHDEAHFIGVEGTYVKDPVSAAEEVQKLKDADEQIAILQREIRDAEKQLADSASGTSTGAASTSIGAGAKKAAAKRGKKKAAAT